MSDIEWNAEEYGADPEDFGVDVTQHQLDNFKIGERVRCVVDEATDPGSSLVNAYEDDEGVIIGFIPPHPGGGMFNNPPTGPRVLVHWEGMDPASIDPKEIEHA